MATYVCFLTHTARKTPECGPGFYRIGTDYFHIEAYEDRIREYTGSYSGVFHAVSISLQSRTVKSNVLSKYKNEPVQKYGINLRQKGEKLLKRIINSILK